VDEAQLPGVEHQPRRRQKRAAVVADIDTLTHQRKTGLGEVDPDLVRAPGLQSAVHQRCSFQVTERSHMGDRVLPLARLLRGAAEPVASILHQPRPEGTRPVEAPMDQRAIAPVRGVIPELLRQVLLRRQCQREYQQPGGLPVQAVDHADPALRAPTSGPALAAQQRADELVEGVRLPLLEGYGAYPRWLAHYHQVRIEVRDHLPSKPSRR
jgi:hypothetical protein